MVVLELLKWENFSGFRMLKVEGASVKHLVQKGPEKLDAAF